MGGVRRQWVGVGGALEGGGGREGPPSGPYQSCVGVGGHADIAGESFGVAAALASGRRFVEQQRNQGAKGRRRTWGMGAVGTATPHRLHGDACY